MPDVISPKASVALWCHGLTTEEMEVLIDDLAQNRIIAITTQGMHLNEAVRQQLSIPYYASIDAMLDSSVPDLIIVAGMPTTPFEQLSALLESGIQVRLVSPFTLSSVDAEKLSNLATQNQTRIRFDVGELVPNAQSLLLNHLDAVDDSRERRIDLSVQLSQKMSRFWSYPDHNQVHWCYELPCGVFHQELEKSLALIYPFIGDFVDISVDETSDGILPQEISDSLVVEVKGSKMNALIKIKIAEESDGRQVKIVSIDDRDDQILPQQNREENFGFLIDLETYHFIEKTLSDIATLINHAHLEFEGQICSNQAEPQRKRVLITGASGQLGRELCQYLTGKGYLVRALIRKLSDHRFFQSMGAEYAYGDILDLKSLRNAYQGVDCVVHAAADTSGNPKVGDSSTVIGTQNILECCREFQTQSLVYISSCSVYDVVNLETLTEIDESSSLEPFPELRGTYSATKLKADLLIQEAITAGDITISCLRPGTFISENGPFLTPIVGLQVSAKLVVVFGTGQLVLPLVFIENLCSATENALANEQAKGQTYNVIDDLSMSKREFVDKVLRKKLPDLKFIYVPYGLLYGLIFIQEKLLPLIKRKPFLTRYRFESSQKEIRYTARRIKDHLHWTAPVSAAEAIKRILNKAPGASTDRNADLKPGG